MADPLSYRRSFAVAGAACSVLEAAAVGIPLSTLLAFDAPQRALLSATAPIAGASIWLIWYIAVRAWRAPIDRAIRAKRAGEPPSPAALEATYHALLHLPRRAGWLRALLATAVVAVLGILLTERAAFPLRATITAIAVTLLHGILVQVFRVIAWDRILDPVRESLLPDLDPLRRFRDRYAHRLLQAALATTVATIVAVAAFGAVFLPINVEQHLRIETFFPPTLLVLAGLWRLATRRLSVSIDGYLAAATSADPRSQPARDDPRAIHAYRAAQLLPYQLAVAKLIASIVAEALLIAQGPLLLEIDLENSVLLAGEAMVVTVGMAIYEVLWHRATMRPLLSHLAARHRPRPETVRTPLSLRSKMLMSFGGLTLFAIGLSLFWSFVQYKTLATGFIQRDTELRLEQTRAALAAVATTHRPTRPEIESLLATAARESARDHSVIYYLPPARSPTDSATAPLAFSGDPREPPPPLPWAGEQVMRRLDEGHLELSGLQLTGRYARVRTAAGDDLGALAVLFPGYRGRGVSVDRQIVVLLFFFVLLATTSMGIVILVANDLTGPIRRLEQRADAMARGDLTRPVIHSAGEADEVGRLTFAFEEMRRALNEKLRSSTEINLSLEQEVTRRTAELERRNEELKGALDALQRTQAELVRAEKMASMGRLVAGIAHEINNPVNAVVNTAGPLETTLDELLAHAGHRTDAELAEASRDVREMLQVIQRGARRTKEIVQALHNYSRGDDDRLVEVDLERGIDESLDLLRHHLRHGITVERDYGKVGKVRGYAGQLHQVFMNLLTNAAQALSEHDRGGAIRIRTAQSAGRVVITVSDDGPGIPKEILPRIFDPFFTTKDVGQGSGLGLSIVHGIVERHGGSIAVDSESGRGTTFTVTLPTRGP